VQQLTNFSWACDNFDKRLAPVGNHVYYGVASELLPFLDSFEIHDATVASIGSFRVFSSHRNLGRSVSMWETRSVDISVRLPDDIAEQAEEVQKVDPEFLSRVVLYGLTRRSIYHQLRERSSDQPTDGLPAPRAT
jgi:hypothetical protein